jgi:hypothetical protein
MAAKDFVSPEQFGDAMNEPSQDSPPRPTMNGEHLGEQFTGLTGKPEVPKARHPNYIGAQTIHEYRTSPGRAQ